MLVHISVVGWVAQSVWRLTTSWTFRESNPGGARFSDRPDRPLGLLYNGYRVFPGGKVRPGHGAGNSPLLVPQTWKKRTIPLPTLWATTGPIKGSLYLCLTDFCEWMLGLLNPYPTAFPYGNAVGSTLLPATREQHDQNCTQSH